MDIAKYMVTALLLSSALGNMNRPWVFVGVMIGTIFDLRLGSHFKSIKIKNRRKENSMGAVIVSIFVSLIATIGGLYFMYQDRKNAKSNGKG